MVYIRIPIRGYAPCQQGIFGVVILQPDLKWCPGILHATCHTGQCIYSAVEINHIATASALVQTIDILCNQTGNHPQLLQLHQCLMGVIGLRLHHKAPTDHITRPKPLP